MQEPVFIFDCDGVLNGVQDEHTDDKVIEQIVALLNSGHYVAINTGRRYSWVRDHVVRKIHEHTGHEGLSKLGVAAEMGGIFVDFQDGIERDTVSAFGLDQEIIQKAHEVFIKVAPRDVIWSEQKRTMATMLASPGSDLQAFKVERDKLKSAFETELAGNHIKCMLTLNTIDVVRPEAGKWAGAQLINDWLLRTPAATARHFVCFGDTDSDYEMARFFAHQGHEVEFVFTGTEHGAITHDDRVNFLQSKIPHSPGTFEYLASRK